jgi:2-polyprenyl-3-methyl-5-hydroxy-6-metoxy-1,4-benzoquinol methylase
MIESLVRLLGWRVTLRFGDPLVMDRWRWLEPRLAPGSIRTFDAGCGNGCFSFAAAARGNQVLAASFDNGPLEKAARRAAAFGLKNVNFIEIDLRQLHLRAAEIGVFDQIICTECIEHIQDDRKLVRDLASCLKPGGRLLLTTPEAGHRALRHEKLSATEDGGHVRWGYTAEQLKELFEQAGLTVAEISYTSGWISQQLTNLMRVKAERVAWALTYPLRSLQWLDRSTNPVFRFPWFGIGVVGTKLALRSAR